MLCVEITCVVLSRVSCYTPQHVCHVCAVGRKKVAELQHPRPREDVVRRAVDQMEAHDQADEEHPVFLAPLQPREIEHAGTVTGRGGRGKAVSACVTILSP